MNRFAIATIATLAAAAATSAIAAPVAVNGVIGSEWDGVSRQTVTHDDNAPTSNFAAPTATTAGATYDVLVRSDATHYYVGLEVTGAAASSAGNFANLYLDLNPQAPTGGSELLFSVGAGGGVEAFIAGGPSIPYAIPYTTAGVNGGVIELAIANEFLGTAVAQVPNGNGEVAVRMSQSFGYSVGGGESYGPNRLGVAVVPEPTTLAAVAAGAVVLLGRRRRRA